MRRPVLVLIVTCLVVVAWGFAEGASATEASDRTVLDEGQLRAAALREGDVPSGWQPFPQDLIARANTPNPSGGPCGLPNSASRAEALAASAAVLVGYEADSQYSWAIYERLYSFPTVGAAKAFAEGGEPCTRWTSNGYTTYRREASAPKLGDSSTRIRLAETQPDGSAGLRQDVVVVRRGNEVIAVGQDRTDGRKLNQRLTDRYAAVVTKRLDRAIEQAG